MTWGRESPRDFRAALLRLARRFGYDQAQEKLFAADGADWCWDVQAAFFAAATPIVAWYHVSEHGWGAARVVAANDAKAWAQQALLPLASGGARPSSHGSKRSRKPAAARLVKP